MKEMKLRLRKNIIPWLKDQLSRSLWFRNFFITRNAWAAFSVNSHIRRSNGEPKVAYPTKDVAQKAAEKMGNKYGVHFSVYKCLYCDGWHCGKNRENKVKSDEIVENTPVSPLSVYYEPETPITYGWAGHGKSMFEILSSMSAASENMELNGNVIDDALLSFFLTCPAFREELLAETDKPLGRKSLQLSKLPQAIADMYYCRLAAFRNEAVRVINAKPKAFMSFFAEAVKKDSRMSDMEWRITGGRASKLVKRLSVFNENKKHIACYILELYQKGVLNAASNGGMADVVTPATFIGFSGERSTYESFSLCPDTFESGYIVMKCDNWSSKWHSPEVIADSCSGVKVVDVHDDTIVLSLDCSSVKESIVFGNKHVPTSKIGEHVVTISEAGEFVVEIFYRRELNAPASDDIRLFVYDFCCK